MSDQAARPEQLIAGIAGRQHGVVSSSQLRAAGLDRSQTSKGVRKGRLHPVHHGVYAVGHPGLSQEGRWMAAVLACSTKGRPAFLSHRSAAVLWGLLPPSNAAIEVTVREYGGRNRRTGIRVHRSAILVPSDTDRRRGIRVTTPARTIFDLERAPRRWRIPRSYLRQAVRQAAVSGYGLATNSPDRTRSELEGLFLALCKRAGMPLPEVNVKVAGFEVDFLWRQFALVVETDGYRFHRGDVAFEDDRRRGLILRQNGFEVLRLSHRQITKEAGLVTKALHARLSAGAGGKVPTGATMPPGRL
jgi:hypothetical protein